MKQVFKKHVLGGSAMLLFALSASEIAAAERGVLNLNEICEQTELSTDLERRLRRHSQFEEIIDFMSTYCPALALEVLEAPTSAFEEERDEKRDDPVRPQPQPPEEEEEECDCEWDI